jgi:uncharacterized coiled-coil protein SlyX
MKKQTITFTGILLTLGCFAFLSQMQAVSPPPDGCYSGFTTAEGCDALKSLTTGAGNTGVGWRALFLNSSASFNAGVGAGALLLNNGDSNTAVGTVALLLNTAGAQNTAVGTDALVHNDTGSNNTAVGAFALSNNLTGVYITALGSGAGTDPDIVSNNVYVGDPGFPGDENVISIGGIAASGTSYTATFIGGIYGSSVNVGTALPVYVDTDGHLGTNLVNASGEKVRGPQGANAQAMSNEFQKQQKRIAEQKATIARLESTDAKQETLIRQLKSNDAKQEATIAKQQRQIDSLTANLQRVSARLEASRPEPQVVTNP